MDRQQTSAQVPLKRRILRAGAFVAAGLLLLSSIVSPALAVHATTLYLVMLALFFVGVLTFIDPSVKLRHPRNLAVFAFIAAFAAAVVALIVWRAGGVVAEATFNPGIAPFDLTVREVPVPVTRSHHFIITLRRGQYPVTSFRYFWVKYTPKNVKIEWTRLETFKVIFDDRYVATCHWSWGKEATWTMQVPPGGEVPGDQP
jgi:hypothetical protein